MAESTKIKLQLTFIKSTKGTVVYGVNDAGETDFIPSVYIKRAAFPKAKADADFPKAISVSITPVED